jgi:hypothetical protein
VPTAVLTFLQPSTLYEVRVGIFPVSTKSTFTICTLGFQELGQHYTIIKTVHPEIMSSKKENSTNFIIIVYALLASSHRALSVLHYILYT